jgi:hypothetical protein
MPIYIGSTKIKKIYAGTTKIKSVYAGATKVYSTELAYYGVATPLSTARSNLSATTVGDYALFGGGYTGSYSSVVDAYNTSLTMSTPTALSAARRDLAATSVGDYALFGGGSSDSYSSVVDAYTV